MREEQEDNKEVRENEEVKFEEETSEGGGGNTRYTKRRVNQRTEEKWKKIKR